MRILFAGTPQIAVPALRLLSEQHEVCAVLCAPDAASGRNRQLIAPPAKTAAQELSVPVVQPERIGREARELVRPYGAELLVCVAYGRIFGPRFLSLFPRGGINLHPSLLPRHRGPSPIPAAILAGDTRTGVSVQELALEMDSGDIYAKREIELTGRETTGSLGVIAAQAGAQLLAEVVTAIEKGTATSVPQNPAEATFSHMISKDDGNIDWTASAIEIDRAVRAYLPWPLAHSRYNGLTLNILETVPIPEGESAVAPGTVVGVDKAAGILIQTGSGILSVQRLQLQNKRPLDWKSFLNGVRDFPGTPLGG